MKTVKASLGCAVAAYLAWGAGLQAQELPTTSWQGATMGTTYRVKLVGVSLSNDDLQALKSEVDRALQEVNRLMSHYQPDSELSRFNRAPAGSPFQVSPDFARVVRFALELSHRTEGALDPTMGPLINLWGFGERGATDVLPGDAEIQAARQLTGWTHLRVTAKDELIKDVPGLTLNLSAVAKGFGVDQIARVVERHGHTNFFAAIAGDVRVMGHNPRGAKWQVGVSDPISHWREHDPINAVTFLSNQALSTSGDYQKFFFDGEGRRLHHIVDPRTGWPVQHPLGSVSVVAPDSMTADGLSTTLFVLGPDAGLRFIETWTNAAALFILREPDGSFRQVTSSRFTRLAGYP